MMNEAEANARTRTINGSFETNGFAEFNFNSGVFDLGPGRLRESDKENEGMAIRHGYILAEPVAKNA